MLEKFLNKILDEEEELVEEATQETKKFKWKELIGPFIIFFLALLPRLYFLYTHDPSNLGFNWYGDVYHRWQIAYLSQTVGFEHGFLRLWDLKGMEYFWGLLHPLATIFLFKITGSVDIILVRWLSIVASSLVIVCLFSLIRRDFNRAAAWASALFLVFFPVILFSDTIGMQEPLGLALLFGGILLWPKYGILTGFLWGLASMERAEYWLFSAGLVLAALLDKGKKLTNTKIGLLASWFLVVFFYMRYLARWTGNFIYPIYWNFLASVVGLWFRKGVKAFLPADYVQGSILIFRLIFLLGLVMAAWLLIKRRRYYLWFLLGFFNIVFIGFMFGFSAYAWGYIDRFWLDRLLAWPYGFLGILLAIFLFYFMPLKFKFWQKFKLGWLVFFIVLFISQVIWKPINYYFDYAQKPWPTDLKIAQIVGQTWDRQGKILVPENMPSFIYALVRFEGIKGQQLTGQMFDVFNYLPEDPFSDWQNNWPKVKSWIDKEDITLIVTATNKMNYLEMFRRQPDDFLVVNKIGDIFSLVKPTWR